jgi:anti-sigma factor RsiW
MSTCEKVGAFVDGELPDAEHREFQDHLASCTSCPDDSSRRQNIGVMRAMPLPAKAAFASIT